MPGLQLPHRAEAQGPLSPVTLLLHHLPERKEVPCRGPACGGPCWEPEAGASGYLPTCLSLPLPQEGPGGGGRGEP